MSQSVRPFNTQIIGMSRPDNLIPQIIPAIGKINTADFRPGDRANVLTFGFASQTTARLGIFVAEKDGVERIVIMLLPATGRPDNVLICITQGFGQAAANLNPLGWHNPLSAPFANFALLKHVINRWGPQMLAAGRNQALFYILRAGGSNELGPFARDGAFLQFVLGEIASQTNNSFSFDSCEAFTFSSGIYEFNNFITASAGNVNYRALYAIDPVRSTFMAGASASRRKHYASGTAGALVAGFEPMPLERWRNEDQYASQSRDVFQYLHNRCMPQYVLNLALSTS
ncbi:MAG TPA: hypothetical protein VL572_01310 [Pyrinomonadaceae bacterium]|nr:hypothetical protein [Pyrinomonadaceae bacterium]